MNVLRNGSPEGDLSLYYGIQLRYPHRFAHIIKLYSAWYATNMGSTSGSGFYTVGASSVDSARSIDRFGWGVEVILFRGYTLIGEEAYGNFNVGYVSLFYEQYNFQNSRLYMHEYDGDPRDMYMREFVDEAFWDTYRTEHKVGLKIAMHLL
jgi:hypothetical protein